MDKNVLIRTHLLLDSIETGLRGSGTWLGVHYESIHPSINQSINQPIEVKQTALEPRIIYLGRGGIDPEFVHVC